MKLALHQEYLSRHKSKTPVVLYNRRNVVLLNSVSNPAQWRILLITWRDVDGHPGFYEVRYDEVVHNGFEDRVIFNKLKAEQWFWDQYEVNVSMIVSEMKQEGFRAIFSKSSQEQVLAAWEIYLIIIDSWMAKHMSMNLIEKVEDTIRNDYSLDRKVKAINEVLLTITSLADYEMTDIWTHQLMPLARAQNAEWLVRLINE